MGPATFSGTAARLTSRASTPKHLLTPIWF